jgi:hypothetical protein
MKHLAAALLYLSLALTCAAEVKPKHEKRAKVIRVLTWPAKAVAGGLLRIFLLDKHGRVQ